ncbi:MAG: DUF1579 family protein [Bacteroidales bacterium]|nr:DUF1579 family protein [Bacteroidales bacterium]
MSEKNTEQSIKFKDLIKKWRLIQRPGENHDLFKKMIGDWKVKLVFYGGGKGWESKCKASNELIHGDRFLIENIDGEIYAPDDSGVMRTETYSSTKIIGYDNYKKAYCGSFVENQNSYMLNFIGRKPLRGDSNQIDFFGLSDEPMLEINDTTMKYTLELVNNNKYIWKVFALALGDNSLAFEFIFERI